MSTPEQFPVSLERVFFVRTHVVSVPNHQPVTEIADVASVAVAFKPQNALNVEPESPGIADRFVASLKTTINPSMDVRYPYSVDMECLAVLTTKGIDLQESLRAVNIVGHNVLYGAIRECVAWMTGRHPYGQLMLGLSVLQPPLVPPNPDVPEEVATN